MRSSTLTKTHSKHSTQHAGQRVDAHSTAKVTRASCRTFAVATLSFAIKMVILRDGGRVMTRRVDALSRIELYGKYCMRRLYVRFGGAAAARPRHDARAQTRGPPLFQRNYGLLLRVKIEVKLCASMLDMFWGHFSRRVRLAVSKKTQSEV